MRSQTTEAYNSNECLNIVDVALLHALIARITILRRLKVLLT
jgi:hypothetical protein